MLAFNELLFCMDVYGESRDTEQARSACEVRMAQKDESRISEYSFLSKEAAAAFLHLYPALPSWWRCA